MNTHAGNTSYELTEIYPVSRERLYRALTDEVVLKKIWGVQQITVDARVGGRTDAVYVADGQDWSFTITYTEVLPNETLRWVTHFKSFPAKETRVLLRFTDEIKGTKLTVRMENFESSEERDANRQAWQRAFATLEKALK